MKIAAAIAAIWALGLLHLAFTLPSEFFRQDQASEGEREFDARG